MAGFQLSIWNLEPGTWNAREARFFNGHRRCRGNPTSPANCEELRWGASLRQGEELLDATSEKGGVVLIPSDFVPRESRLGVSLFCPWTQGPAFFFAHVAHAGPETPQIVPSGPVPEWFESAPEFLFERLDAVGWIPC